MFISVILGKVRTAIIKSHSFFIFSHPICHDYSYHYRQDNNPPSNDIKVCRERVAVEERSHTTIRAQKRAFVACLTFNVSIIAFVACLTFNVSIIAKTISVRQLKR